MYNRWLSSDELYHHGVLGQEWGKRNGPPYPLDRSKSNGHKLLTKGDGSPQGKKRYKNSEKTAHKRAERKVRTETKEQDKWKINKWHLPQQPLAGSLHDYLYENNEAYKKNYDEAEPLRKEYSDAVERETAIEQKILNGDFGYTRPDGTNPQALNKAYDEWNKRIKKTQDIYDKLSDHYEKVLKDVNESYDAYKTLGRFKENTNSDNSNVFNAKISSSEPKKSLKDRITSFKDRLLGGDKKTTEKTSYNIEPKTTEKVKTRNGEEYEIVDWDGDGQETIKRFKASPERHIGNAKRAALSEAREIISWYADEHPEAKAWMNASNQKLGKRVGLRYVNAGSNGSLTLIFGDTHGDLLGHEVEVEYDLRRNKVIRTSVQG